MAVASSFSEHAPRVPVEDFRKTLAHVKDVMLDDEYDDEFLRPGWETFWAAWTAVTEAFLLLGERFPRGSASADGEGGLRVTWERGQRDVRLVCPAGLQAGYVYHDDGQEYGGDQDLTGATLAYWLDWLLQP
jgi:hypothetical protein